MASNELIIGGEYSKKVIPLIDKAKHSIFICMFIWRWYEKDPFSDMSQLNLAFVRAVRRGVRVYAVTNFGGIIDRLKSLGIEAKQFQSSNILHTKGIVIDSEITIIGSHNFSASANYSNVETSMINYDKQSAERLEKYILSL